jgi:NADPH:quinone reductase-like Zn-dependent oxidoreductase
MKAIVQDKYGPADVLKLEEIDKPEIADDEVLVRVFAAGVDRGVWHLMTGLPHLVRIMGFGLLRPKTRTQGVDFAGRVEEVGNGVANLKPGDEVFGTCAGSFAEYAAARENMAVRKPENLSFEQAAAVPTSGVAALQALRDKGQLRPGQRALIIGASGGVGSFAVQIAKALEAHVTGVCSTAKMDMVRSIGADAIIDYTREDFADAGTQYDVIIDIAGNRPLTHIRRALTPNGTLVIVGGEGGGRWLGGIDRQLRASIMSPLLRQNLRSLFSEQRRSDLKFLQGLLEEGKVRPAIDRTFALSDAPSAIRHLENGHSRGKIVIAVQ